jgi:shikimate dehydrogenase
MRDSNAFALAGIIGWPVAQSRSPVIQNFWLSENHIAGRYILLPVTEDGWIGRCADFRSWAFAAATSPCRTSRP